MSLIEFGNSRAENNTNQTARDYAKREFFVPGVNETIIMRGRIGLEDVRRFIERQLRVFYERHGHGNHVTVETRPWLAENIIDDEYRLRLPETGLLREQYDRARDLQSARTILQHRASEFCVALVTSGRQDVSYRDREEIVTRIFNYSLLQDALSGFSGQFEQPSKEYWIMSRAWTTEHDIKWDYATRRNINMTEFYQSWLITRDLAVNEAEQRLRSRDAAALLGIAINL